MYMTEISYPGTSLASKTYTCETFSKSVYVDDWHEAFRNIPEECIFKIITTIHISHEEWVEKVVNYMKKNKKGFEYARNKVPISTQNELFCLKSKKIKGYLTIDTIDGNDVPFEIIESIVFNDVRYTKL